ncbi:SMI1/KNR4 family protein [Sphingobium sp. AP50]|uniref:SMI1/KNR4 family protein n=1 Tax=Sphingobium sp. AP50 TaxID=1884369 RepID=UPI000B8404FF
MPFPVAEPQIDEAEQALRRKFPMELRARLLRENGGEIVAADDHWLIHPVWDPSDRKTMGRTASHIVRETDVARSWPSFPFEGIPLAANGSGNRIILLGDGDQVFVWDHETGKCLPISVDWS